MVRFGNEAIRFLAQAKEIILDIFFPRFCVGCNSYGALICNACLGSLPLYAGHRCESSDGKCIACFEEYGLIACVPLYSYEHPCVQTIVHALKYRGIQELGARMAESIVSKIKNYPSNSILIPIPLHEHRMRERGFNQAELMARHVGSALNIPVITGQLVRVRNTKSQFALSRDQRIENMKDAFRCLPGHAISGRHVILLDDVMTTGATLAQGARALREGGAASISAFVFARGS